MIHIEKIEALEELGLTREEALEWVDMLAQKQHKPWQDVVNKHVAMKYKTNCIICYRDKEGNFSYHRYIDTSRLQQIYGFQFSPNWIISTKDEVKGLIGNFSKKEALELIEKIRSSGWTLPNESCFEEYDVYYNRFIGEEDRQKLIKEGVIVCGLHSFCDYWVWKYIDNIANLCIFNLKRNVSSSKSLGAIRLFIPVKDVVVTE